MRYVLAVSGAVFGSQSAALAFQFAQTLLAEKQEISQIFFFQDGTTHANLFVNPANDEVNLAEYWAKLSQQYAIPLHLCVSASARRGVVDHLTSPNNAQNLAKPFILAGLGEFTQAVLNADRLIQF